MNYYPFHLGDYAAHTGHLDPLEDLAYRRMLDLYYLREAPLPCDVQEISRLIRMKEHAALIRDVLNEFFVSSEDGWRHSRCDQELERMQDKQAKARASAAASVNARKAKAQPAQSGRQASDERTLNERSADVELPTPTPTPTPNTPKAPTGAEARFERFWQAYPKKVGKDAAKRTFLKRKPDDDLLNQMLAAIKQQSRSEQWTRDAGQYIPNPSTWLNQGRWQDGHTTAPVTNGVGVHFI